MENSASKPNRFKKYREKKKLQEGEEYLKKERERKKAFRLREKESLKENSTKLQKKREEVRRRVQLCRDRKKAKKSRPVDEASPNQQFLGSYHSSSTLKKAVWKTKKQLPKSPTKRVAVVRNLAAEFLPNSKILHEQHRRASRALPEWLINQVKEFFESDEIGWQAPGKRDYKSIRINGQKVQKQKRYLIMNISEAYELFLKKNDKVVISKSKFFELRPPYVVPMALTPHNVCVCVTHANYRFMEQVLSQFCSNGDPTTTMLTKLCCDLDSEYCMTNQCLQCLYDVKYIMEPSDLSQIIKWKSWTETEGSLIVQEHRGELAILAEAFNAFLKTLKTHVFVKKQQSTYFAKKKETVKGAEAVVQVDFAENYSLISQDEIQSAHWQHSQVTIFTCCIWLKQRILSYVVVSDDLSHSKESAWLFLKAIIAHVQLQYKLKTLYIFSDNCAAQFKSKYTAFNICHLAEDLCVKYVEWNTFAAGHGKGAVDAIGGQVKRKVWNAVKSRQSEVHSPLDFYSCLIDLTEKINVLFISKQEVDETSTFLNERWRSVKKWNGIRQIHSFQKCDDFNIYGGLTATSELMKIKVKGEPKLMYSDVYSDSEDDLPLSLLKQPVSVDFTNLIANKSYVIVSYDGERFPGIVEVVANGEVKVSVMEKKKNHWCFPEKKYSIWYSVKDVVQEINPPDLVNVRGLYLVRELSA